MNKWGGSEGRDPTITVRLPPDVVERIEAWGAARGVSRSEAIRAMILAALEAGGLGDQ